MFFFNGGEFIGLKGDIYIEVIFLFLLDYVFDN